MHFVVTASATKTGQPVYRAPADTWTERFDAAQSFGERALAEAALEAARREEAVVCDPYLIDAAHAEIDGEPRLRPVALKEQIRADGPTVALP